MKKQQLRKELKSLRNQLSRDQVDRWSKEICANIMLSPQYRQADVIFGYLAFGNEPNIDIVLEQARLAGKTVCVPQIISETEICAVRFEGFGQLSLDRYGIRSVSGTDVVINPHEIALVLVPGVGFAKNGNRIGMGAGYYDRFLAQVDKAVLMGVTYNALLCRKIPVDDYDKAVQYLVTETNITLCE